MQVSQGRFEPGQCLQYLPVTVRKLAAGHERAAVI